MSVSDDALDFERESLIFFLQISGGRSIYYWANFIALEMAHNWQVIWRVKIGRERWYGEKKNLIFSFFVPTIGGNRANSICQCSLNLHVALNVPPTNNIRKNVQVLFFDVF